MKTKQDIISQFGEILKENNITCIELYNSSVNDYSAIFEMYSPLGEDVELIIQYDGTIEDFAKGFINEYEMFDVDEHVEQWIPNRGKNGIPESIRALVEDAEEIEHILEIVSSQIEEKVFGRKLSIKELIEK